MSVNKKIGLALVAIAAVALIGIGQMTTFASVQAQSEGCSQAEIDEIKEELSKTTNAVVQANILSNHPCA